MQFVTSLVSLRDGYITHTILKNCITVISLDHRWKDVIYSSGFVWRKTVNRSGNVFWQYCFLDPFVCASGDVQCLRTISIGSLAGLVHTLPGSGSPREELVSLFTIFGSRIIRFL